MMGDRLVGLDGGEDAHDGGEDAIGKVDVANGVLGLLIVLVMVPLFYVWRDPQMRVEPPILSQVVAVSLWPSVCWLQD
jgi:hypothetical protein